MSRELGVGPPPDGVDADMWAALKGSGRGTIEPVSVEEVKTSLGVGAQVMKLVLIESPFAGDVETNLRYLKACMLDSLSRGEAPFASHMLYTQVLDDDVADQRALGISAGLAWGRKADFTALYVDRGISGGMRLGIKAAVACGRLIVERRLGGEWDRGGEHD